MAGFAIKMSGLDEFRREVAGMARRAQNKTALFTEAGEIMTKNAVVGVPSIFREQGPGWKPTLRGGKILEDKGLLKQSVTYTVEANDLVVGTPVKYGGVHQYGATIKAKNAKWLTFRIGNRWARKKEVTIPARPFIKWTEKNLKKIARAWADMVGGSATVTSGRTL